MEVYNINTCYKQSYLYACDENVSTERNNKNGTFYEIDYKTKTY